MTSELNELLPPQGDAAQLWIVGSREQVIRLINELTVKRVASDRAMFTPLFGAPFAPGKYISVLERLV